MDSGPIQLAHEAGGIEGYELATFSALTVQVWELANAFFDETEYIWRTRFTFVKVLYIWSRYVPLVAQITSMVLNDKLRGVYSPTRLCVGSIVFRVFMSQQSLTCMELILLVRVYALYNQSRRVKYFLCAAFLISFAVELSSNGQIIRTLLKENPCIPQILPLAALFTYCVTVSCFQGLVLSMTLFKYVTGRRYGWARTPLTSLVLREGIIVTLLIFGIVLVILLLYIFRVVKYTSAIANYAWYISLLSVTGCRLILGLRKLAVSHRTRDSQDDYDIELTSNLDMVS